MSDKNPIVLVQGDESARDCAEMAKDIVFGDFPFIVVDTGVQNRLATNDQCIEEAAEALIKHQGGIKVSTASNADEIKAKGWKSVNIRLRPLAGCIGMYRIVFGPGAYQKPVGVARYGSGDFYSEVGCEEQTIDGHQIAVITQHLNISDMPMFAELAMKRARQRGMQLIYSSKWTISKGEQYLPETCKRVWSEAGLVEGKNRGQGDFYGEITDMSAAFIPTNIGTGNADDPISEDNGGWLIVTGNANGDTFGDIVDFQHGGKVMGSEVACRDGFSYQESPGGTAPGRYGSDYRRDKFFIPMDTLNCFTQAVQDANPDTKDYCDRVMAKGWEYLKNTPKPDRGTREMLEWIAKEAA